jgi:hypothetical protein
MNSGASEIQNYNDHQNSQHKVTQDTNHCQNNTLAINYNVICDVGKLFNLKCGIE